MATSMWGKPSTLCLALLLALPLSAEARNWSYTYHPDTTDANGHLIPGQLASADGPRTDVADVTAYAYDTQGNLTRITNALGHLTQITAHDPSGRPLTLIDPNGVTTTLTYDARGRLKTRTIAGKTTAFDYDGVGNLTGLTLPTGVTLTYTYDAARRLTAITDGLGNRIAYVLDAAGNRLEERIQDAGGALRFSRAQVFDELSRLRQVVGLNGTRSLGYDAGDNLTAEQDGEGNPTAYAFDALGRLTETTDALQGRTVYRYDAQDQLTSVTDPNGHATVYSYDGLGNLTQLVSPDTGTTTYTYDAAGNRLSQTDAKGQVIQYRYDALNRLIAQTYPADPSQNVTLIYDEPSAAFGIGRLTRMVDASGSTYYGYTATGQLASESRVIGGRSYVVRYGYDSADQLTSITYPSGRVVAYERDGQTGQIRTVTTTYQGIPQTLASNLTYAPFGPLEGLTYGNGLTLAKTFDSQYRLTDVSAGVALSRSHGFDGNDDLTAILEPGQPPQTFEYDPLRRLAGADGGYGSLDWTYDPVGNRLTQVHNGVTTSYSLEDGNNWLLSFNTGSATTAYQYDANGNPQTVGNRTFVYDSLNRLTQIKTATATLASYRYNALHQRVMKTQGGISTVYLYDATGNLIAEVDNATGATTREYVYLGSEPLAMLVAAGPQAGTYAIHTDHLGTPQALTNQSGTIAWQARYSPFGRATVTQSSVTFNLRFPGQYFDQESGLHYNWHRYYDPQTGRYVTSDPIGLEGGLNTYAYVSGSPVNYIDPFGLVKIPGIPGADGETSVHANPGPDATDFRPEHAPDHIHLGTNDGPRVRTDNFQPLSEDDARRMSRKQRNFCASLSDESKGIIRKRQRQIFRYGRVLLQLQAGGLLSISAACRADPMWCLDQLENGAL